MNLTLRFGIPSLDDLIGSPSNVIDDTPMRPGIHLSEGEGPAVSTSLCIVGPEGTGKSILALHLASRYLADAWNARQSETRVLYVSTDLSYVKANQVWESFRLDRPNQRNADPFLRATAEGNADLALSLLQTSPVDDKPLANYLQNTPTTAQVAYIDLAGFSAGDDWGYLNRLLGLLPQETLPHLLVIDAVEGFETMVGERDAFGERVSRRSRIAQVLRLAFQRAHVVFVLEEPRRGRTLSEQFVTDGVIRLRSPQIRRYNRRTIEIVKVRGQTHARGQHSITIRNGRGSTTGPGTEPWTENHDDPALPYNDPALPPEKSKKYQAYVMVFPSLHFQSRRIMESREPAAERVTSQDYAGFGIPHLDKMLVQGKGLPANTITALIGDTGTQKTRLGRSFLAECFRDLAEGPSAPDGDVTGRAGVAVMITTQDVDANVLATEFSGWLAPASGVRDRVIDRIICRRLENHDLPAPVLIHIIRQAIRAAEDKLASKAGTIRVVIEDFSTWKEIFPEIREDPLFLPFLLFYLRRSGVTCLIIDTHPGRPDAEVTDAFDSELRSLVDHQLYTWRVPFYGESRIAIAPIPPLSDDLRSVIRELKWSPAETALTRTGGTSKARPAVDPHFELYSGLERGAPKPVALEVRLFNETPQFSAYINLENALLTDRFVGTQLVGEASPIVLRGVPANSYEVLRECCVRRDTRLEHTLLLQIDEYWQLPTGRGKEVALRSQHNYLNDTVDRAAGGQPADGTPANGAATRSSTFRPVGYELERSETADRVPFTWDFGFLICAMQPWLVNLDMTIPRLPGERALTVREVWEGLPKAYGRGDRLGDVSEEAKGTTRPRPTWRKFFGACSVIAQSCSRQHMTLSPFNLAAVTAESFSALVLEIWASEIYEQQGHTQVSSRQVGEQCANTLVDWLELYSLELYKTWTLLEEVINLGECADAGRPFQPVTQPGTSQAVASRHWYKTACALQEECKRSGRPDGLPTGLPGHFATRGDWFLGVADASRSFLLADKALDLLTSERANFTRLQMGLGLPTRDIFDDEENATWIRTYLVAPSGPVTTAEVRNVSYKTLCSLGANDKDKFFWLWRSSIGDYDLGARVWQKALTRMVIAWDEFRKDQRSWVSNFAIYDRLKKHKIKSLQERKADRSGREEWAKEDRQSYRLFESSAANFLKACNLQRRLLQAAGVGASKSIDERSRGVG